MHTKQVPPATRALNGAPLVQLGAELEGRDAAAALRSCDLLLPPSKILRDKPALASKSLERQSALLGLVRVPVSSAT